MALRWTTVIGWVAIAALPVAAPTAERPVQGDVEQWLRLVQNHRPGEFDDAVRTASEWPWSRLGEVVAVLQARGGDAAILRSASLLSDVAHHVPVGKRPTNGSGRGLLAEDGERRGEADLDAHLDGARRLLDAVPRGRTPDASQTRAHVIAWYRTVTASLARHLNLADMEPHVQRALARFPDDPGILMDAGCFYETFAAPLLQSAMGRPQAARSHLLPAEILKAFSRSPEALLTQAERYFRRAIEREPRLVEARVRLGRVLTQRGRTRDAIVELQRGIAGGGDATVTYYGHLFLGAALTQAGQLREALDAYRSAMTLFPDAQSPHLASSHLSAELGDAQRASELLRRVVTAAGRDAEAFDPWWVYHRATGRDYDVLYPAFNARVRALPPVVLPDWEAR